MSVSVYKDVYEVARLQNCRYPVVTAVASVIDVFPGVNVKAPTRMSAKILSPQKPAPPCTQLSLVFLHAFLI